MKNPARFEDPLRTIESFGAHFLVTCPGCAQCAHVYRSTVDDADVRFVCPSCGRNKQWQGNRSIIYYRWGRDTPPAGVLCIGAPLDWFFHYPVWLSTPCCGETCWAYNEDHLDFLESYVSASLRERAGAGRMAAARIRNSSLASRLPSWLRATTNRERILAAITKLRERLPRERQQA